MVETARAGRAPFVGRRRELAALRERLVVAGHRRGGVALVAGEPGIGKTRLVLELADEARAGGWQVLIGRAFESEWTPPYLPFAEALRPYVRACPEDELRARLGDGAAEVALVVREVRGRLPDLFPGPSVAPEPERYALFDRVADFLLNIAATHRPGRGLFLVLDDLHWADKPTLLLLLHLARRLPDAPLLVTVTYRTVELDRTHPLADVLADLNRERLAERLLLTPLSLDETAVLVAGLSGAPAPPSLVDAVYRETEGNPFFVEEVLRQLQAEGRDLADPRVAVAQWQIPEGVRQAIGKRLSRLSVEGNRLLRVAAVLGDRFGADALAAVSGLAGGPFVDALDEALAAGVLREEGDRCHFAHALIRQTLYGELSTARRLRLHQQAAEALDRLYAANPNRHLAELALHFFAAGRAGNVDKAVAYARRAGDRALTLVAYEEAARLFGLALQALDLSDDPEERTRCDLLLAIGHAHRRAGEAGPAMEAFRQAADVARTRVAAPDRAHLLARAALGFEDTLLATGVPRTGLADPSILLQDEALRALGEEVCPLKARVLAGLARALHFAGGHERGQALSEEAVIVARATGDKAALAYALNARRMVIWGPDDPEARLAVATELKRLAEEVGDTELVLEGLRWREQVLRELGEMDAADAELEAHVRLAEKVRQPQYRWSATVSLATRAMIAGRFAEAERLVEEARAIGERAQMEEARLIHLAQIGILRRERRDLPGLDAVLPSLERAFAEFGGKDWLVDLSATYAELGRLAEARQGFDELAADDFGALARDWLWLASIAVLADVCAFLGDRRRATTLYRFLLPHAGHVVAFGDCSGAATRSLGALAATMERWDEAETHFEAALRLNERIGAVPALARTQYAYAAMLLVRRRRGDLPRARDLLAKALAVYRELDLPRRAAQVEVLLAKPGPATAAPLPIYPAGLTEREVEIVCLIAAGRSNREIAEALFLSVRTVERHITNIYAKIEARGRADATAFAFRHGLASTRVT